MGTLDQERCTGEGFLERSSAADLRVGPEMLGGVLAPVFGIELLSRGIRNQDCA
jgi:hypothetical protein